MVEALPLVQITVAADDGVLALAFLEWLGDPRGGGRVITTGPEVRVYGHGGAGRRVRVLAPPDAAEVALAWLREQELGTLASGRAAG